MSLNKTDKQHQRVLPFYTNDQRRMQSKQKYRENSGFDENRFFVSEALIRHKKIARKVGTTLPHETTSYGTTNDYR
jgi:hypothetical protein